MHDEFNFVVSPSATIPFDFEFIWLMILSNMRYFECELFLGRTVGASGRSTIENISNRNLLRCSVRIDLEKNILTTFQR